jgi:ATP-dependent DNA helicase RecQ
MINSTIDFDEQMQKERLDRVRAGDVKLLYVAPERFRSRVFTDALDDVPIRLFAVDEAHCISQWGHDFRPDYTRLSRVIERLRPRQVLGLTATATPKVQADVVAQLGADLRVVVSGFKRDNLTFEVKRVGRRAEKIRTIEQIYRDKGRFGIVYCATRKSVEAVAEALRKMRIRVAAYHGGLPDDDRKREQERFQDGRVDVIVATNAFGMGVDKPDVRFIVHYEIPGSVEAYYQEAGRAGRDGRPSRCVLLYTPSDRHVQEFFIEGENPSPDAIREVWETLCEAPGDVVEQTRAEMAEGLEHAKHEFAVSTILKQLDRAGYIRRLYDHNAKAAFKLLRKRHYRAGGTKAALYEWLDEHPDGRDGGVAADLDQLAAKFEVTGPTLRNAIRALEDDEVLDYSAPFRGRAIQLLRRVPADVLDLDWDGLSAKRESAESKLNAVVDYAELAVCRHRRLLEYFGETADDCGTICDVCLGMTWSTGSGSTSGSRRESRAEVDPSAPVILSDRGATAGFTILSLAKTLDGVFGARRISEILGGSSNKQVKQWKLDRFDEFGAFRTATQETLNDAVDAVIRVGLLERYKRAKTDNYQRCRITERGDEALARREASMLPPVAALNALGDAAAGITPAGGDTGESPGPTDHKLLGKLRDLRAGLAETASLPRFMVMSNAVLEAIAAAQPASVDDLRRVKGVGDKTVDRFGEAILAVTAGGESPTTAVAAAPRPARSDPAPPRKKPSAREAEPPAPPEPAEAPEPDPELLAALKQLRGRLAEEAGVPRFAVATNRVLDHIAGSKPTSLAKLRQIPGVGATTVDRFGKALIDAVKAGGSGDAVADEPPAAPAEPEPAPRPASKATAKKKTKRAPKKKPAKPEAVPVSAPPPPDAGETPIDAAGLERTRSLLTLGRNLADVARFRHIEPSQAAREAQHLLARGSRFAKSQLFDPAEFAAVAAAAAELAPRPEPGAVAARLPDVTRPTIELALTWIALFGAE